MLKTTENLVKSLRKEANEILKKRKSIAFKKFKAMKHRVKNTRQAIKKRVSRKFRLWYRLSQADKNGDVKCYTCNRVHSYKEVDAGHFIHSKLDFDIRNFKIQCVYCNRWLSGNLSKYRENLEKDYGEKWVKKLEKDAQNEKRMEVKEMLKLEKGFNIKIKSYLQNLKNSI